MYNTIYNKAEQILKTLPSLMTTKAIPDYIRFWFNNTMLVSLDEYDLYKISFYDKEKMIFLFAKDLIKNHDEYVIYNVIPHEDGESIEYVSVFLLDLDTFMGKGNNINFLLGFYSMFQKIAKKKMLEGKIFNDSFDYRLSINPEFIALNCTVRLANEFMTDGLNLKPVEETEEFEALCLVVSSIIDWKTIIYKLQDYLDLEHYKIIIEDSKITYELAKVMLTNPDLDTDGMIKRTLIEIYNELNNEINELIKEENKG